MADPIAEIRNEVATTGSDPLRWAFGGRLLTEDSILNTRGAGRGLAIYEDLLRDPQVATCIDKRVSGVVGREWKVTPGDATVPLAVQAADLVSAALNGMKMSQAARKMLKALLMGVAIGEVMWTVRGDQIVPAMLLGRDPRRFMFRAIDGGDPVLGTAIELRLLTKAQSIDGVAIPARKFVVHRFGDAYENPWGLGLGQRLFWPVFFKRQGTSFWLNGLDKFSQPTVVGKYANGTSTDEQEKLLAALAAVSREAGVAIPEGMTIDLLEAKRAGTFAAYEDLARYMDEDIAKAVLGESLTTQAGNSSGGGSRALGQVHNEVRLELVKSDADDLSDTLNAGLITWIVDLNFPGYAASGLAYPTVWWDVAVPDDLLARAQRDGLIKALGYEPTPEYIATTYGEGWVKATPTLPAAPADPLQALFAEAGRIARRTRTIPVEGSQTSAADAADILTGQVGPMTAAPIAAWFGQISALVDHAESMQDIADGLLALYPKLGTADLAEMIGQALAVGDLTGRVDLQDGVVPPGGDA